ncbi:fibronectin type III domain-containing protein [Candidatus Poriferisocius sp.]|uniref:fibronectin type III domain-containing protein n=1 Tax=Candidatus Poriferisocius sp. TaxID=3101276 RepID=UPI003B0165C1
MFRLFSGIEPESTPSRSRRRVGVWVALGSVVLLAALLAPASSASAQSPPSAPDVVARPGDGSITLVWQPVSDGGARIIRWEYRQIVPVASNVWLQMPGSGPATTTHTVVGLTNGVPYRFEVRAVNFAGPGVPGASRASTEAGGDENVSPSTTPAPPVGLRGTAGNSQVALSWRAPVTTGGPAGGQNDGFSPITAYEYRQKTGDGAYAPWTIIIGSGPATTTHTITGLVNGTTYQFEVRARNANGTGAAAETPPVLVATVPGPPRELTGRAGNRRVVLLWAASSDGGAPVTSWQYRRGTGSADIAADTAWVVIPGSNASTTSYTVGGLNNSLVYRFEVRAVNDIGLGIAGTTGVVEPGTVPARPIGFAVSLKEGATDTAVLTWSRPGDGGSPITGYQYSQRAGSGGYGAWQDIVGSGPDTGSHEVSGLTAGTAYQFRVRAVNDVGGGASSTTRTPIYPGTAPAAPESLTVANSYDAAQGTRQVTLSWDAGDDGGAPVSKWEYKHTTSAQDVSTFYNDQGWVTICDTTVRADAACRSRSSITVPRTAASLAALGITAGSDGSELLPVAGETYYVVLRAVNEHGTGLPSGVAATTIPRIVPSTPPAVYFRDADEESFRVWWPSSTDGGANTDIPGTTTRLRYQWSYRTGGDPWTAWSNTDTNAATILGATWGEQYRVRVRAENAVGHSDIAESAAYTHGGPPTPGADEAGTPPVINLEAAANQVSLSLARTGNVGNVGGITGATLWEYSYKVGDGEYGGWISNNVGFWFDDIIVDFLDNGAPHTFRIRGVNGQIAGPSLESEAVVPGGVPLAPFGLEGVGGDRQVTLTWILRVGGPPITKWQFCRKISANSCGDVDTGGGWTDIDGSGPDTNSHTIENLVNGTAYTFLVRAWSGLGRGERAQAIPAIPGRAPEAPYQAVATAGRGQVTVIVTVPREDHNSPVTSYQIRKREAPDGTYDAWQTVPRVGTETSTVATVTSVANGISYTFQVRAVNAYGPSEATTLAPVTPVGPPPAVALSAVPGDAQAELMWVSPSDGGSAITGWQYRTRAAGGAYGGWSDIAGSGADTDSYTVIGLVNGVAYSIEVRAVNAFGPGDAASAGPVTPANAPSAPVVSAERGDGATTVSWTAGDDGGSAVVGWQLQVNGGEWMDLTALGVGADGDSYEVPTDDGTAYTFGVRAVSDVGQGAAGTASVEAGAVPAAPDVAATEGGGEIEVSWTAGDDGGSAVTGWHHRMRISVGDYGDWTQVSDDTTSVTVSGLASGTGVLSYTFEVRAVNGVGEGAAGTASVEVAPVGEQSAGGDFYSGVVSGPGFCSDLSLGGARLFAHDSDGDGTADVCSLPYTRREAIARQNAVDALVYQYADEYAGLVNAACEVTPGDADCGGDTTAPPPAVPINSGGPFYSGIITGPSFCANRSLGGPTTYPHDSDGDGVADVCALPYTRREAIARQLAGDILAATYTADFRRELATACRGLTGADYGDNPAHLETDACAP